MIPTPWELSISQSTSKPSEHSDRESARRNRQRVLSYSDLQTEKGVRFSRQWIRKLVKQGKFPKPVKIGEASIGFIETEVDAWIEGLIAQRDGEAV